MWARLANAWHALLGGRSGFIEGGRELTRKRHDAIVGEPEEQGRRAGLARALKRSPFAPVFADASRPLASLESDALAARIRNERRASLMDPLGPAPVLQFAARLRAELTDLRRINWGVAQGASADAIRGQLLGAP